MFAIPSSRLVYLTVLPLHQNYSSVIKEMTQSEQHLNLFQCIEQLNRLLFTSKTYRHPLELGEDVQEVILHKKVTTWNTLAFRS